MAADLDDPVGVAHWRRLLTNLDSTDPVVGFWVPWYRPVQAGCYTDINALIALHAWVNQLHRAGRVSPAVVFTIEDDTGETVGVLYDTDDTLQRCAILRAGGYLVHSGRKLEVLDERTFHATYCDIAYTYNHDAGPRSRPG